MAEKHEFASPGWFEALHRAIARIVREGGPEIDAIRWTLCEVFTDVPAHLAQGPDRKAAWHCRIRGREIAFGLGEIDDADLKIVADYETTLPIARTSFADPAAEARATEAAMSAMVADKMQIHGNLEARPPAFERLHDEMVDVTA